MPFYADAMSQITFYLWFILAQIWFVQLQKKSFAPSHCYSFHLVQLIARILDFILTRVNVTYCTYLYWINYRFILLFLNLFAYLYFVSYVGNANPTKNEFFVIRFFLLIEQFYSLLCYLYSFLFIYYYFFKNSKCKAKRVMFLIVNCMLALVILLFNYPFLIA